MGTTTERFVCDCVRPVERTVSVYFYFYCLCSRFPAVRVGGVPGASGYLKPRNGLLRVSPVEGTVIAILEDGGPVFPGRLLWFARR